ncbi:AI-2E family transporter [Halostreptopolyspora alba]|uniref:AI-2E family transporter n=1 Tax=Halostreptopolyspora alba TaxID=2487137 RepID=A0A3N0EB47_9ACTN|nr:AI-2E family transporter [Nocardiopsaceae bacterium YIM 96095]
MQLRRPWYWSLAKIWGGARRRANPEAESERPAEEPPAREETDEVGAGELLRQVSDVCLRILIIGVVVGLLLWGLTYIRVVALPAVLAVFLTALLMPPTEWMRRRGVGRGLSTALTMLGALAVLAGVVTLIVQPAVQGFGGLVQSVGEAIGRVQAILTSFGLDPQLLNQLMDDAQAEVQRFLAEDSDQLLTGAWAAGAAVLEVLTGLILVLVLTVYFVHSGDRLVEWITTLFPAKSRRPMRAAGAIAYGVMGRYVRGVALVGLIDAVGIGAALFFLIDTTLAIPLIVLTFIGAFLPVIGAFVTGLLAALVAFVTESWVVALVVVAVVLVVQQLESHVFAPRVYGKALELPSAIVLLAIAIGFVVGGVPGMFLATPVTAVLAALLRNRQLIPTESIPEPDRAEREPAASVPTAGGGARASGAGDRAHGVNEGGAPTNGGG